jgi:hypothetical protein
VIDAIGYLLHEPPRAIYGIQVAGEVQVIGVRNLISQGQSTATSEEVKLQRKTFNISKSSKKTSY